MPERICGHTRVTQERSSRYPYVGYKVPQKHICFIRGLGRGGFGTVYLAEECHPNTKVAHRPPKQYAVKVLEKAVHPITRIEKEFQIHCKVARHPNILQPYAKLETGNSVLLLNEYIEGGDFASLLEQYGHLIARDNALIKASFLQILDAVAHMHEEGISHGDLKPENILCKQEKGGIRLLLADFGVSTNKVCIPHQNGYVRGTSEYLPPECWPGGQLVFPRAIDIWSLGVILYKICTKGAILWKTSHYSDTLFYAFMADPNNFLSRLPLSHGAKKLLKIIWDPNPQRRVNIHQLRLMVESMTEFTPHFPKCQQPAVPQTTDRLKHHRMEVPVPIESRKPKIFAYLKPALPDQGLEKQSTKVADAPRIQVMIPALTKEIHEAGEAVLRLFGQL